MEILIVLHFIWLRVGFSLHCACRDSSHCTRVYLKRSDFNGATLQCAADGGRLPPQGNNAVAALLYNTNGNFWIGKKSDCWNASNNTVEMNRGDVAKECPSSCVSVSANTAATQRGCEEHVDGFLCEGVEWERCWEYGAPAVMILGESGCKRSPCQQHCEVAPHSGGAVCSCYKEHSPSKMNPQKCSYSCASSTCEPLCKVLDKTTEFKECRDKKQCVSNPNCTFNCECFCPDGFVRGERLCEDVDECHSNHQCQQICTNKIGSYECSCEANYTLLNRFSCSNRTLVAGVDSVSRGALSTSAAGVGLTVSVLLVAIMGLLYYFLKRKSNVHRYNAEVLNDVTETCPTRISVPE